MLLKIGCSNMDVMRVITHYPVSWLAHGLLMLRVQSMRLLTLGSKNLFLAGAARTICVGWD